MNQGGRLRCDLGSSRSWGLRWRLWLNLLLGLRLGRRLAARFFRVEAQAYSPVAGVKRVFLDDRLGGGIARDSEEATGRDAVFLHFEAGG